MQSKTVQPSLFYTMLTEEAEDNDRSQLLQQQLTDGPILDAATRSPEQGSGLKQPKGHLAPANVQHGGETSMSPLEEAAAELNSGKGPRFFTDFCKAMIHPRSVVEVPLLDPDPFSPSGFGDIVVDRPMASQLIEEISERVRVFAEECDTLEAFHLFSDDATQWAGLAAAAADVLADDYPARPIIAFGTYPGPVAMGEYGASPVCRLTRAVATARWGAACMLRVPLAPPEAPSPHLRFNAANVYHTSAVLAAAIDSCTLPYRLLPHPPGPSCSSSPLERMPAGRAAWAPAVGSVSALDWCSVLTAPAASIAVLGMRLPAEDVPFLAAVEADDRLSARERRLRGLPPVGQPAVPAGLVQQGLRWLLPEYGPLAGLMAEHVVWRGGMHDGGNLASSEASLYLTQGLETEGIRAVHRITTCAMPLPVPLPFPHIFGRFGSGSGKNQGSGEAFLPRTCPMMTRLCASPCAGQLLQSYESTLCTLRRQVVGKDCLRRWGMDETELEELREALQRDTDMYPLLDLESDDDLR